MSDNEAIENQEMDENHLIKIRKEKLEELQERGKN